MAGTRAGGKAVARTNLAKDPDFYKKIGALGGATPTNKLKGFAANRALARKAGALGGRKGKRGKKAQYASE